jgi:hypothetical protein
MEMEIQQKGSNMKTINRMFALIGAAVVLAGCASTSNEGAGALGNDSEKSVYNGSSSPGEIPASAPFGTEPAGPNGSVGRNNPFGAGAGSGLTPAS